MQDFMHEKRAHVSHTKALSIEIPGFYAVSGCVIPIYCLQGTYPHVYSGESPFVIKKSAYAL